MSTDGMDASPVKFSVWNSASSATEMPAEAIMAVEAGRRPEKMSDTSLDSLKASKILATIMMTMMDGSTSDSGARKVPMMPKDVNHT